MSQTPSDKSSALLALISKGLQLHATKTVADTLGDRSQYIGMSDIGRALECPRSALACKAHPDNNTDLQRQLILQRGHWNTASTRRLPPAISASSRNLNWQRFTKERRSRRILISCWSGTSHDLPELKSTENLPSTLYASYEAQVYGQIGLLQALWNSPAFDGRTFRELCRERFGITMPHDPAEVDMEAWVLCVSMSDATAYGPYLPDANILNLCLDTAATLWKHLRDYDNGSISINDVEYAKGFHALCAYCDWNAGCPKFADSEYYPELQPTMEQLSLLKENREIVDAAIEKIESGLKATYACSSANGGWLNAGTHRFRVSQQAGRRSLSKERLLQELANRNCIENVAENLVASCEMEGKSFQRLFISPINSVKQ